MRIRRCWLPCLGLLLATLPAAAATASFDAAAFDAYVAKVMQDWRVPGLAVAVVNRDGVIHLRGYGTREWGRDQPVDADTIFAVGSNGKSFTSVLLGALADRRQLRLDDPLVRHLPAFRMAEPYATAHVTFEDALGHLSGLPEQSGLTAWYLFGLDRREMVALVASMPPATSLRGGFAYNNTMFTVAGEAAAAITGLDYDEAIRRYLTTPLGLSRTTTTLAITRTDANVARPHVFAAGVPVPVPYHDVTGAAPAGSANSTARDMARYVRMWLNDGCLDGQCVLSPEQAAAIQRLRRTLAPGEMPHIRQLFGALADPALAQDLGYGLGLARVNYAGQSFVMHGGGIDGMTSWMAWSQRANVGFVALSNGGNILVPAMLMFTAVNQFLGLPADDVLGRLLPARDAITQGPVLPQVSEQRPAGLPVATVAGQYRNRLGLLEIHAERDELKLRIPRTGYAATLRHLSGDQYAVAWDNPALPVLVLTFRTAADGTVRGLELESPGEYQLYPADASFARVAEEQ